MTITNSKPNQMTTAQTETAIGNDLGKIDLILAIGTKFQKAKARKHRKACYAEIKRLNESDSEINNLTDSELLAALLA